jgi:erythromycin esterase
MKHTLFTCLSSTLLTFASLSNGHLHAGQTSNAPVAYGQHASIKKFIAESTSIPLKTDSTASIKFDALKAVSSGSYEDFKKSVQPLIAEMSSKRIVALGEGTHGTSEFYKLRYWISRILIEEKGFNHIAFENDYSDGWYITQGLDGKADLNSLMKKHLLSIWQNEETKELLTWVREYNRKHAKKVVIDGLDYVMLTRDVELLKEMLGKKATAAMAADLEKLAAAATLQDQAWNGMNIKGYKIDYKELQSSSRKGYLSGDSLKSAINGLRIKVSNKVAAQRALTNLLQGFAPFYEVTAEATRDSLMAVNASLILENTDDKMIIWAHNAHVAKTGIYNNAVGGAGGHILKLFPDNYYVLGMGTATGTFAATTDPRDTYTNPMNPYPLETPIKGSWEEMLSSSNKPVVYFDPAAFNTEKLVKPLRFIGFSPKSGPTTFDKGNISDLFDGFIFIKESKAATPLK